MSNVYESIMTGLNEAVEDSKSYENTKEVLYCPEITEDIL